MTGWESGCENRIRQGSQSQCEQVPAPLSHTCVLVQQPTLELDDRPLAGWEKRGVGWPSSCQMLAAGLSDAAVRFRDGAGAGPKDRSRAQLQVRLQFGVAVCGGKESVARVGKGVWTGLGWTVQAARAERGGWMYRTVQSVHTVWEAGSGQSVAIRTGRVWSGLVWS